MGESVLVKQILLAYGRTPGVRLFRNNVGVGRGLRTKTAIRFGLCVGSSDIIGWKHGRFVALEAKAPGEDPTPEQSAFLDVAAGDGCLVGVVRSLQDAERILGPP